MAEKEVEKIQKNKKHRSSKTVLKKLATGELELNFAAKNEIKLIDENKLSKLVNKWLAKEFNVPFKMFDGYRTGRNHISSDTIYVGSYMSDFDYSHNIIIIYPSKK